MATKKAGSTARFGARYGRRIKVRVLDVDRMLHAKHECPSCTKKALKRTAKGIWECRTCGLKMAGGAYSPEIKIKIPSGVSVSKATAQPAESSEVSEMPTAFPHFGNKEIREISETSELRKSKISEKAVVVPKHEVTDVEAQEQEHAAQEQEQEEEE